MARRHRTVTGSSSSLPMKLARLAWWNWGHDRPRGALPDFRRLDIDSFLTKYEARERSETRPALGRGV